MKKQHYVFAALGLIAVVAILMVIGGYWPHTSGDTAAVRAAGYWTQVYAVVSILQLAGLGAAAYYASKAWQSSSDQVAEAKRSANAAERLVRDAETSARRVQRAYLSLRKYKVATTVVPDTDNKEKEIEFCFKIPNGGATPAYNVAIKTRARLCAENEAAKIDPDDADDGTFVILQAACMTYRFGLILDGQELADFESGKTPIGGAILIEYDDVFRETRHRLVCRMVTYKDTDGLHKVKPCGIDEAT